MLQLHLMIVRLEMRMEALEDSVKRRIGGFQAIVEGAFDSLEAHCVTLKVELEAR